MGAAQVLAHAIDPRIGEVEGDSQPLRQLGSAIPRAYPPAVPPP